MTQAKETVAAFDFDGTLTTRDTLLPFLLHSAGTLSFMRNLLRASPCLAGYGLGLVEADAAKERLLSCFLAGELHSRLAERAREFSLERLPPLLRSEALSAVRFHRERRHRLVLVSASLEIYLAPWARKAGFDDVLASRLEVSDAGRLTGRLEGGNCNRREKRRRLERLLGARENYVLFVYADSPADEEMLAMADHAFYRRLPDVQELAAL